MMLPLVALDLLPHRRDVLVDLGRDTVDAGLGERHARAVRGEVGGAAWGAFEPPAGDHHWNGAFLHEERRREEKKKKGNKVVS
jgi:hypothetical protein